MGKKLYVGNLPFTTTDQDLNDIFAQAGQVVSAKVIMDRESGRSKGFGFVEMNTDDDAKTAISRFNSADFNGRPLTVNEARPMAPRNSGDDTGPQRGVGNRSDRNQRW